MSISEPVASYKRYNVVLRKLFQSRALGRSFAYGK